jgi:group I intron endonuclease
MRNCYENIPSNQINPYGFIYLTTNLVNGKKYIGQRKIQKCGVDRDEYLGSGILITKAIKKYGKESFKREVLDFAENSDELDSKEEYYISLYNAVDSDDFYNIDHGGRGYHYTEESLQQWVQKMNNWRETHPEKAKEAQAKAADGARRKNGDNLRRFYEEHTDDFLKRYEKSSVSIKKYIEEHPEEEAQRIQKILDKQYERTLFPLVCIERNEIYVAMWHAKYLIKRTAENIKRHLNGMYKWCGKDPETGNRLHWRVATIEDLDNIPLAKGGEAYEQLCREFLSDTDRQAV